MKVALLTRSSSSDEGTFGTLEFGTSVVYTTELPWRDNVRQRSCVPVGTYTCVLVSSPKFGRVYKLQSVPGRDAVLIHPANFAGDVDKGYTSELHGCIAPSLKRGVMKNNKGMLQQAGLLSRPAVNALMAWANGDSFTLEIK